MNRCTHCGYGYLPGQAFCLNCGMYLKGVGQQQTQQEQKGGDTPQGSSHPAGPWAQSPGGYQPPPQPRPSQSPTGSSYRPSNGHPSGQPYQPQQQPYQPPQYQRHYYQAPQQAKPANRIMVGLLGLFLGGLGVQFFVMKKWAQAIISLVFCWTGIPAVVGVLQGIRILCLTDEEYAEIYYDIPMGTPKPPSPSGYTGPPHPNFF